MTGFRCSVGVLLDRAQAHAVGLDLIETCRMLGKLKSLFSPGALMVRVSFNNVDDVDFVLT